MLRSYLCEERNGFRVYCAEHDLAFARTTARAIETAGASLTAYFEVTSLPRIRAVLAPDRDRFDALVADLLRVQIERPSDPRRIAQPQRGDIVLLSPSAYAEHSSYEYVPDDYRRMISHELVHVLQEQLSPNIEESPLWWDEGLAVYLSEQWRTASQFCFREQVLRDVRSKRIPALAAAFSDPSLAYSFGWTLVRFLEQEHGREAIVAAVKNVSDGNVLAALGENPASLEESWQAWLRNTVGREA